MSNSSESDAPDPGSLLSAQRRRYLLYCLHLYTNPVRLPDIAHQVTVWEQPESPDICLKHRLKTYMSLYHDHLPTLAGAGVVQYDQEADVVSFGPAADRISVPLQARLQREVDTLLRAEWPA